MLCPLSAAPPWLPPIVACLGWLALTCIACGDDTGGAPQDASVCLSTLPRACTPLYRPTFDNIFANRLGMTCGASSTGGSCHAAKGAMAGLVLETKDAAYDALLGAGGGRQRVIPGDPECSLLVQRLESNNPGFSMPPGAKLSADERCAIEQWIANGAER
jgi:hypothetical protein